MTEEQKRRINDHRPAVGLQWDEANPPPRVPFDRPEQWTILLTSGNHGLVGAYGHTFPHAEGDHERINVVDEAVVIKLRERLRQVEAAGTPLSAAEQPSVLTDEQIDAIAQKVGEEHRTIYLPSEGAIWGFARAIEREVLATQSAKQGAQDWISVADSLPEKYCLAVYETPRGKQRIIRAMYVERFTIEATGDDSHSEINDENDTEYLREGWYELIDNWGEYSSVNVCEGVVTHWQPLPPLPGAAPSLPAKAQEGAQPDELRRAVREMAAMLEAREWAEHVSKDRDAVDLEVQITELVGLYEKQRQAAQEGAQPDDVREVLQYLVKAADWWEQNQDSPKSALSHFLGAANYARESLKTTASASNEQGGAS